MYGQAGREEIVDGGYIHVTDTFHITLHLRDDSFSTCSLIILRGSLLYLIFIISTYCICHELQWDRVRRILLSALLFRDLTMTTVHI